MEMHQVRYFLAVARTLNFTRAAEECNVSQPSLTRAVQKLEDELGGELLRRERSLTHLTELGQMMLPHLERTFEAAQTAKALAKGIGKAQVGRLTVGVARCIDGDALLLILAELASAIAGLELSLVEGTSTDLIERALRGDIDLLMIEAPDDAPERLVPWHLYLQNYRMLARSDVFPTATDSLELAGAGTFAWIDDGGDGTARLRKAAERIDVPLDFRHQVGTAEQARRLVLAGLGHAITEAGDAGDPRLVLLGFVDEAMRAPVVLAGIAGRRRSLAAEAFVRAARAREWRDR